MWLVRFAGNWADECDCDGFTLLETRDLYDEFVAYYQEVKTEIIDVYFGTNEWFDFAHGQQMLFCFNIFELSNTEMNVISKFFGKPYSRDYGIIPFWYLVDRMNKPL